MAANPIWNDLQARLHLHDMSAEQLARVKDLPDDEILQAAGSIDALAIVESNRRLKNAMQDEERAIRRLTWWLLVFTIAIFALTAVLVWLGWRA